MEAQKFSLIQIEDLLEYSDTGLGGYIKTTKPCFRIICTVDNLKWAKEEQKKWQEENQHVGTIILPSY